MILSDEEFAELRHKKFPKKRQVFVDQTEPEIRLTASN